MKRRSPTNSRPAEDLAFRREYADGRYYDELLKYFPSNGCGRVRIPGLSGDFPMYGMDSQDPHHIFGGRMGRWDRPWNIAMVHRTTHDWLERWKTDGRVIGLRFKLDQGLWDEADAYRCLKLYPLGWVQGEKCQHQFAEAIRVELVRAIKAGEL